MVTKSSKSPVIITQAQNIFKHLKWKLRIQKEIDEYSREIPILDKMYKGVKAKTKKVRKIKRKYEMTSIDENPIIKQKLKLKFN